MKTKNKKTRSLSILLMFLSLVLLLVSFLPSHSETEIYDKILRLHVLANSDSEEDQLLKLKVRDAVLELSQEFGRDIVGIETASSVYSARLDEIKAEAERVISENGYDYEVSVSLGKEYYPPKNYEEVCLPSGNYLSLKIQIGNAEGENWWCVLYPPLCLSAATADKKLIEAGFTGEQIKIITENDSSVKYNVKFKLLESFKRFFDYIGK